MAYIHQISEDEAAGALRSIYDAAIRRAGVVSKIITLMSLDERVCEASMGLYIALMKRPNALPAPQREMLATVVSNVNECYY